MGKKCARTTALVTVGAIGGLLQGLATEFVRAELLALCMIPPKTLTWGEMTTVVQDEYLHAGRARTTDEYWSRLRMDGMVATTAEDEWGGPIRLGATGDRLYTCQSAGPDGVFETDDDYWETFQCQLGYGGRIAHAFTVR